MLRIKVEFSGGLETLFEGKKELSIEMKEGTNIENLITTLKESHLKTNPDLFISGDKL